MALTYTTGYDLANDWNSQKRVIFALGKVSSDIYAEGTGVTGHALRAAYATKVANALDGYGPVISKAIASNATIVSATTITDQNIYDSIAAAWNLLAGA